jgi:hypothetical protein
MTNRGNLSMAVIRRLLVSGLVAAFLLVSGRSVADDNPPPPPPASVFPKSCSPTRATGFGTSTLTGTCSFTADSVFQFTVTGKAFGPYPGTFVAKGSFTLAPPFANDFGGLTVLVTNFNSRFRIESGDSVVTGTQTMAPFTVNPNRGACGELAAFNAVPNAAQMRVGVVFETRVKTHGDGPSSEACFIGTTTIQYGDLLTRGIPNFQDVFSRHEPQCLGMRGLADRLPIVLAVCQEPADRGGSALQFGPESPQARRAGNFSATPPSTAESTRSRMWSWLLFRQVRHSDSDDGQGPSSTTYKTNSSDPGSYVTELTVVSIVI